MGRDALRKRAGEEVVEESLKKKNLKEVSIKQGLKGERGNGAVRRGV